jgi:transposase
MLIIGYCFGIRSERKLCEEVRLHLAYRWFCRRNGISNITPGKMKDGERAALALKGAEGKRLTYRQPRETAKA